MHAPPYAPDLNIFVLLPFFGQITAWKTRRSGELELIQPPQIQQPQIPNPMLFKISEREGVWRPSVGLSPTKS